MRISLLSFFLLLLPCLPGSAQTVFDELYRPDELLEIVLKADWDSLLDIRNIDSEIPGKLYFHNQNGQLTDWKVDLSVRGRFRRRICDFPPVKIDFSKKELNKRELLPFDNMKLVTHCLDNPKSKDIVVREYLIYRMYELLSPYAFRTQLVQVVYQDKDPAKPRFTHFGILIENSQIMAHRLGIERTDTMGLSPNDFAGNTAQLQALFQYLIGNTDWDIPMGRNFQLLHGGDPRQFLMVPYDFDFSGFVAAPYAIPDPNYKLRSVRQRVYLGEGAPTDSARAQILAQKAAMLKLIRKSPYLTAESKADCIAFLNSGFREIKRNRLAMPQ
jgi:hypothetical protein